MTKKDRTRENLFKRLRRRGLIKSSKGVSTEYMSGLLEQSLKDEQFKTERKKSKQISSRTRENIGRRLKRHGVITSYKGLTTFELNTLWENYESGNRYTGDAPTQISNYQQMLNILEVFLQDYDDVFMGWYKEAWRYREGIAYFWQRIDPEKTNNDKNFFPKAPRIYFVTASEWVVGEELNLDPLWIVDYLEALYDQYLI